MASFTATVVGPVTTVYYISQSVLPSRLANSAHVVHQCGGFAAIGADVTLIAKRSIAEAEALPAAVETAYGVSAGLIRFDTVSHHLSRWGNLRIAAHAMSRLHTTVPRPDVVLTRNLYAAYALAVLGRRPIVFETHKVEAGLRGHLQRAVMAQSNVLTIVISDKLREILTTHHGLAPRQVLILHDAAPDGISPLDPEKKRTELQSLIADIDLTPYKFVCGYFGQLYAGRGIDLIAAIARARPGIGFLIFGGHETELVSRRRANRLANLHFVGFVPHPVAQRAMAACDLLLMPYQRSVSIGATGPDTARWMSPMKMFEYLASGTPIISSDLPVLREVLDDGTNALLARPDDLDHWLECLDRLVGNADLGRSIGAAAHRLYARDYTWSVRARKILEAARGL